MGIISTPGVRVPGELRCSENSGSYEMVEVRQRIIWRSLVKGLVRLDYVYSCHEWKPVTWLLQG